MPRFFVSPAAFTENTVRLSGEDAHHISYSLRMAVGDEITVANGEGGVYLCRISAMDGVSVLADIVAPVTQRGESPVEIHLFQAYPKADKLEFIIQKAVELGVSAITPFESERCIKRPRAEKVAHILERQQKIAAEAAKQCGRATLPTVHAPLSFSAMLKAAADYPLVLFAHPDSEAQPLRRVLASYPALSRVALVVGSEGGFSPDEVQAAKDAGFVVASLGERILRCETAPLFLLSTLAYKYELPL